MQHAQVADPPAKRKFPFMRNKREKRMFKMLWDQLFEELKSCRGKDGNGVPDTLLESIRNEAPSESDVDATDIYKIEIASFPFISDHDLKIRLLGLRDMIRNLSTEQSYRQISSEFNTDLKDAQLNLDEAYALSNRLYRRYVLVPSIEKLRTRIAIALLLIALAASALSTAPILMGHVNLRAGIDLGYALALSAGISGAIVSTMIRLYRFDARHEPLLTWLNLEQGKNSIFVTPFLGGVFATILVILMRGDLLQGPLFPNLMEAIPASPEGVGNQCWNNLQPTFVKGCKNYADISKLIIWCFISGWSERFVPDVLDKLSSQGMEKAGARESAKIA